MSTVTLGMTIGRATWHMVGDYCQGELTTRESYPAHGRPLPGRATIGRATRHVGGYCRGECLLGARDQGTELGTHSWGKC